MVQRKRRDAWFKEKGEMHGSKKKARCMVQRKKKVQGSKERQGAWY